MTVTQLQKETHTDTYCKHKVVRIGHGLEL